MHSNEDQIDAVISWVDGDDPKHRRRRLAALGKSDKEHKNTLPSGFDATRFSDNNEIEFCIRSILKFAPWIRNIYVVTDNQVPEMLTPEYREEHNIHIVDHKDIFRSYEWALPTFNTRTIETALWRVPGLASKFIYFNDDFLLTKPVQPEDFFKDDKTVLRGSWSPIRKYSPLRMKLNDYVSYISKKLFGITRSMHTLLQIRSAKLAGFEDRYFHIPHVPHPIKTNVLSSFFDEQPEQFKQNIKYPFRSTDQFSSIFLASHLDIKNEEAILKDTDHYLMVHGEVDFSILLDRKLNKIKRGEIMFTCLQSMEKFSSSQRKKVEGVLEQVLASE